MMPRKGQIFGFVPFPYPVQGFEQIYTVIWQPQVHEVEVSELP